MKRLVQVVLVVALGVLALGAQNGTYPPWPTAPCHYVTVCQFGQPCYTVLVCN